jgi:hypothetical protein
MQAHLACAKLKSSFCEYTVGVAPWYGARV